MIPLRPRDDEAKWRTACALLPQTLDSLLAQTNPAWIAVIAGHARPEFLDGNNDSRITFHLVDWSPSHPRGLHIDKSWKIAFASYDGRPHVSQVYNDAGCRRFAARRHRKRYRMPCRKSRDHLPRNHLAALCGSTAALSTADFPLPRGRDWNEWNKVPYIHHGHNEIKALLSSRNLNFTVPKERYVAYIVGHDASLSVRHRINPWKKRLAFYLIGRRIGEDLARQFSLQLETGTG